MSNLIDIRPKFVDVVLDKERRLLFDLNAFASLEEEYGSLDTVFDALGKGKVKALRDVIWAGLLHDDENLTPKDVGKLLGLANLEGMVELVNKALTQSMPSPGKNEKNLSHPPE